MSFPIPIPIPLPIPSGFPAKSPAIVKTVHGAPAPMADPTDQEIREMAEARVGFKGSAVAYVLVNLFLIGVWWFTDRGGYYWPVWVHLGWGLGLAFHAWKVYGGGDGLVKHEEEKLKAKYGRV